MMRIPRPSKPFLLNETTGMTTLNTRGFTLVEVIFALGLSVVTVGAIYTIYLTQIRNQVVREDILDMQQHARAALDVISRELKMAGYDPRGVNRDDNPSNDFDGVTYDPSRLVIKTDLNGNGLPSDSNESIVFSYDSRTRTLRRNTGGGRQSLGEHIQTFAVAYFDRDGRPTIESQKIRQIEITLTARTLRPDPRYLHNKGYRTFTLHSRVTPRNLELKDLF